MSDYQRRKGSGPHTIFSQQRRYFDLIDDARHPRDIFIEELCAEIQTWVDMRDLIMLMIDSIEYIRTGVLANRLREWSIIEAVSDRYLNASSLQPTY